jgi:hypothetical protein
MVLVKRIKDVKVLQGPGVPAHQTVLRMPYMSQMHKIIHIAADWGYTEQLTASFVLL